MSRHVRHIDAQGETRWYRLHDSTEYPYRRALCGRGAYVVLPPDGEPSGQWADEEHVANCRDCLRRLARMDPDEAAETLSVRRELAALGVLP